MGATNYEAHVDTTLAFLLEPRTEDLRRHLGASRIARYEVRSLGESVQQALAFPLAHLRRRYRPGRFLSDFAHLQRPVAPRPLFVIEGGRAERRMTRTSNYRDDDFHRTSPGRSVPLQGQA